MSAEGVTGGNARPEIRDQSAVLAHTTERPDTEREIPPPWGDHVFTADEGWCEGHHVIESGLIDAWRVCLECGHIYRTEDEWRQLHVAWCGSPDRCEPFACEVCAHDF